MRGTGAAGGLGRRARRAKGMMADFGLLHGRPRGRKGGRRRLGGDQAAGRGRAPLAPPPRAPPAPPPSRTHPVDASPASQLRDGETEGLHRAGGGGHQPPPCACQRTEWAPAASCLYSHNPQVAGPELRPPPTVRAKRALGGRVARARAQDGRVQ